MHFAVPCFVFLSGIVLYNKYSSNYSILKFYKKRFISTVPPYVLFSIAYLYLTFTFSANGIDSSALIDIIFCLFTGEGLGHLWFMTLILQLYRVYPLIEKIYGFCAQRKDESYLLLIILLIQTLYIIDQKDTSFKFIGSLFYFVLDFYFCERYKHSMENIRDHYYPKSL
jgi:surface polysaccharide O-acyltransferase-like enzyme